ncbi:MAG: LPXTG cell wall anchor domain-containing protein, partial [Actinomycetaceae bacterium]|nr:LPXTG cell wall anchor domain-containing protein [Actinomycetaceae bacterium]
EGTQTDEDNDKGTQTDEEKDDNTVAPTQKPADPQPTKTVTVEKTVAPAPAPAAPVTAQKAPLAKTGASSMLVLLMAAGLATAGTGVVLARRNA